MGGPIRGNRQSATILVLTHTTQDCDNKMGHELNGGYNDDDEGTEGNIDDDAHEVCKDELEEKIK